MIHQFDHRWATYDGLETRDLTLAEKQDPTCVVMPRYWVAAEEVEARVGSTPYMIGFRDIARSTDERTAIMSLIASAGVGHTAPILILNRRLGQYPPLVLADEDGLLRFDAGLYANFCSLVFDYVTRQKMGGTHLTFFILRQLPLLTPRFYIERTNLLDFIIPRVLELTYTAWDMQPFARDLGYAGSPFRWDSDRRFVIRCELDALYFHLYGITRADADYILDTFPIVRRKDEATHGYYRTKETILNIFDHMANNSYVSPLDPPAGDPRAAHSG
jgi:hypothetical protein